MVFTDRLFIFLNFLLSVTANLPITSYHVVGAISHNCITGSPLSTIGCCLAHRRIVPGPYVPYTGPYLFVTPHGFLSVGCFAFDFLFLIFDPTVSAYLSQPQLSFCSMTMIPFIYFC